MSESLAELVDNMEVAPDESGASNDAGTATGGGAGDGAASDKSGDGAPDTKSGGEAKTPDGSNNDGKGADESKRSAGSDDSASDDDSGYIADELVDDSTDDNADQDDDTPTAPELSPELTYIVNNLPDLTVRGKTANGNVKTYQVKAAGQLPEDFEFATKREELVFTQQLAAQELRAQNLQAQFQQKEQQKQTAKYSEQENADIRHDIGQLQREGKLAKFKYPSTDKRFNDDPAVKEAQSVMEYMNKKNEAYVKEGKLYRISFADAYEQYQATKPDKTVKDAQAKEDKDRKEVTRRIGGSGSANAQDGVKMRPAPSMGALIERIDNLEW